MHVRYHRFVIVIGIGGKIPAKIFLSKLSSRITLSIYQNWYQCHYLTFGEVKSVLMHNVYGQQRLSCQNFGNSKVPKQHIRLLFTFTQSASWLLFPFDPTLTIVRLNNWCCPCLFEYGEDIIMYWWYKGSRQICLTHSMGGYRLQLSKQICTFKRSH